MSLPVVRRPRRNQLDPDTAEYLAKTLESLDRIRVDIFLCGSAINKRNALKRRRGHRDIRLFLKRRLEKRLKQCHVRLGEHKALIHAYSEAVGPRASNLADHEFALAKEKMDLVVIFPCSPGSFAELGMFCLAQGIPTKMRIFVDKQYRNSRGYVMQGPVKAAAQNNAGVFFVDYLDREKIWEHVHHIVLEVKARKRKRSLLSE
jgi:hypothetical protein